MQEMPLNPAGQYGDDRNLRARQRFWEHQDPYFDMVAWVLGLAGLSPGLRILDAGCGNGVYLRPLAATKVQRPGATFRLGCCGRLATGRWSMLT
jgi:2-polyprenyl-3-methyl-5-hydroxy-6-metoxy-1,4-benzoquinol methylase